MVNFLLFYHEMKQPYGRNREMWRLICSSSKTRFIEYTGRIVQACYLIRYLFYVKLRHITIPTSMGKWNGQTKLIDRYFQALFSYKFIFQKQNSLKRQPLFLPRISLTKKPLCISVTVIYLCFFVRDNCFAFLVLRLIKPNWIVTARRSCYSLCGPFLYVQRKSSVHLK